MSRQSKKLSVKELNFSTLSVKARKSIAWILVSQLIGLHIVLPVNLFSQEKQREKENARSEIINLSENSKTNMNPTKRFALIIGVDKYEDVGSLSGAVNDAELLAETLVTHAGFPKDQVILLTSRQEKKGLQPTRPNILEQLAIIREKVPEDGNALLFVAFAGHGMERIQGKSYLMPADAKVRNPQLLEQTAIGVEFLKDRILETGVRQVVLVLDSCRNTPQGKRFAEDTLLPESISNEVSISKKNQNINVFVTLFATSLKNSAYENRKINPVNGYYTLALVDGLKGKAANEKREVTIGKLIKHLEDVVPKQVKEDYDAEQIPYKDIYGGQEALNLVLAETDPIIDSELLNKGGTYEGQLESGDERIFQVPLEINKLFSLEFSSIGSDALISVEAPDKKILKEAFFAQDYSKSETVSLIISKAGSYRLKIKSRNSKTSGNYRIKFAYRDSIPGDEYRISAQMTFEDAEKLSFNIFQLKSLKQNLTYKEDEYLNCEKKFNESIRFLELANEKKYEKQDYENEIKTRRRFGDMYRAVEKDDNALDQYNRALIASRAIEDRNSEAVFLILISQIYLKKGKSSDALLSLNNATDALQLNPQTSQLEKRYRAYAEALLAEKRISEAQPIIAMLNINSSKLQGEVNLSEESSTQEYIRKWGNDTIALSTIVAEDSYAVILTTPKIQIVGRTEIKRTDLNKKILAFRYALQNPGIDPRPAGKELYDIIVKPVEKELKQSGAKNILWSFDGNLRYLPPAALYDGRNYLVENYNNSILTLRSMTDFSNPKTDKKILAMGETKEKTITKKDGRLVAFPALPGVYEELKAIVKNERSPVSTGILPGKILLDSEFTKNALLNESSSGRYNIAHIASPLYLGSRGDDSFFVIGDGNVLPLKELFNSSLIKFTALDLLVLSSCNTGLSLDKDGVNLETLAEGMHKEGAKSVIATLWGISDQSTPKLMKEFYRQWATKNMTKSEALRNAQLSLLESGRFSHPFYWSPFVLYGNWR